MREPLPFGALVLIGFAVGLGIFIGLVAVTW